jgi:Relaxase/Mobilisation nuclease domain
VAPKITTSASIRSCFAYDLGSKNAADPPGEWVAGSVIGSAREMAKATSIYRQLRPDCKKAIWSCSLSLPPADGRREAAEWGQIAEAFLKKMGVDTKTHAWAAHRHQHENDHIHIRLCRISSSGSLWNQEHSAKRAIKICGELEGEFNLESHDRTPAKKKRPTMAEEQIFNRKGIPMSRTTIQAAVDSILKEHPQGIDFAELQALLAARQIDVQPYAPGGVLKGVSYLHDSVKWPGSKIGSDYSAGLPARGVRYSAEAPKADTPPAEPKKTIPRTTAPTEQFTRSVPSKTWTFDSKNAIESGALASPFGIVCAAAAEFAIKLIAIGVEMFCAILRWLNKLLSKIGLNVGGSEPARNVQIAPQANFIDVPSRIVPDPLLIEAAAAEINAVAAAIEKNDSTLLPESAQNLAEYFEKQDSTEETETDPFNFFGDEPELRIAAQEPATPAAPPKPWPALKAAAEAHHTAAQALAKARAAAAEDDGLWGGVKEAATAVDQAHGAFLKVQDESKLWLASSFANRAAAALGGNPYTAAIKAAEALLARRRAEVATAQRDEASKPKRQSFAAPELVLAEKEAAENLTAARIALLNLARKNLTFIRQNPMQISLAVELEVRIKRGIGDYVFGRNNSALEACIAQLRAAVEAERLRQNPALYDPEHDAEVEKFRSEIESAPK